MTISKLFGLAEYEGWTDSRMKSTMATIRHSDLGMAVVNRKFGRGTDIKFK